MWWVTVLMTYVRTSSNPGWFSHMRTKQLGMTFLAMYIRFLITDGIFDKIVEGGGG